MQVISFTGKSGTGKSYQATRLCRIKGVEAIIVACGTVSAIALSKLHQTFDLPIIGVIEPGARVACETTKNGSIGVIATRATIGSHVYNDAIHAIRPNVSVIGKACPLFVPLVEEGWIHDKITDEIILRYLDDLLEHQIDTLILGCTHYPLLRTEIHRLIGDQIRLVNPAYETAISLKAMLAENGLENTAPVQAGEPYPYRFYVSDDAERFAGFATSVLPVDVKSARIVAIEDY